MTKYKVLTIMVLLMTSCSSKNDSITKSDDSDSISTGYSIGIDTVSIFGTVIHLDEVTAIKELSEAGVLKCDTIMMEDGEFDGAVIEFAGVRFGMKKGFVFMTSRQDRLSIDSLVCRISKYYDPAEIDDDGEPEWSSYHWNRFDTIPGRPYIRIRPLHSADGGLVMTWNFKLLEINT